MNFRFDVNVSDDDYFDYNKFWLLRSSYGGKRQITSLRITLGVIFCILIFISLFIGNFTFASFLGIIPLLILLLIFQFFVTRFLVWSLKGQIKSAKKNGKMGYSPSSVITFNKDSFVETTEENTTEQKYSAIERISIVDEKMIYIHVNNVMAYMLPLSCFASKEQYDRFFDFMKSKCDNIDVYL